MAEGNPDKILEDLEDYRRSGDLERLQSEIVSDMDIESVDDNHATVKHAWLGFATDREGIDRLTCEFATWEMRWDEEAETWMVDEWATVETLFQVDILKDRIPWKKIRGLIFKTDKECANVIAESPSSNQCASSQNSFFGRLVMADSISTTVLTLLHLIRVNRRFKDEKL